MAYVPTTWKESGMTSSQKADAMNNLETQYDEAIAYMGAMTHDDRYYTKSEADAKYYRTSSHPSGRSDTGEGCGIDAAKCDGYTLSQILSASIPYQAIGMWVGGSIPNGFAECNGLYGTPDMRNRIPKGCGEGTTPRSIGGSATTTPTADTFNSPGCTLTDNQIPNHQHSYNDITNILTNTDVSATHYWWSPGADITRTTETTEPGAVTSRTAHYHNGNLFAWTGYKDMNDNEHTGALDIRPLSRAVKFIMRLEI